MQRITRVIFDNNNSEKKSLLDQYNTLLPLLKSSLTERTFSIFAIPRVIDDNNMGWYTNLEGQPTLLSDIRDDAQKELIHQTLQTRINDVETTIQSISLTSEQKSLISNWLPRIKSLGNQIYVVNNDPVIVNTFEPPILPKPIPPIAPIIPAAATSFWRWWHFLLLGLLLLALLGALWYFFCPFGKKEIPELTPVVTHQVETKKEEPIIEVKKTEPDVAADPIVEPGSVVVPDPEPTPTVKNDPNCISQEEIIKNSNPSKMVMIFDNSASMNFTLAEKPATINSFIANLNSLNYMPQQEVDKLIKKMTRLPSRLSSSKKVALSSIDKIQPNIDIGLVSLNKCPAANKTGFYSSANRKTLKQKIQNLTPLKQESGTPLYNGIEQASRMLDGVSRNDYVLIISDGEDNCSNKNICTLANYIASKQPRLKINIVDIAGQHKIDCVANMTGGKVYIANNHAEVVKQMSNAVNNLKINRPVCK